MLQPTSTAGKVGTAATAPPAVAIAEAVRVLVPEGVCELRALGVPDGRFRGTWSGYFDDADELASWATRGQVAKGNLYVTVQEIDPALFARRGNRMERVDRQDPLTSDGDVRRYRWLLLDLDPVRPTGIASTEAEHAAALERADVIAEALGSESWPEPVRIDSGNGAYLLYPIDLETSDRELVRRSLEALGARYSDSVVKVDQTMHNPARIIRLPGTVNRKGDDAPERPHRRARLLHVPEVIRVVPRELLEQLAAEAPEPPRSRTRTTGTRPASAQRGGDDPDRWRRWLDTHGIAIVDEKPIAGGVRLTLESCPFRGWEHAGDSYVILHESGAVSAECRHDSCTWRWPDLRERYEPGCYDRRRDDDRARPDGAGDDGSPRARAVARLRRAIIALADRCDHANSEDGEGFSRDDQGDGHRLADLARPGEPWSLEDAARAYELAVKYQRQLGELGFPLTSLTDPRMASARPVTILTAAEVLELPTPGYRVAGYLHDGALCVIYGPSGEGKSFLALDVALCVATGADWHGHRVREGEVLYVAAEGAYTLRPRIAAWLKYRSLDAGVLERLRVVPHTVAVTVEPEMEALGRALEALESPPPALIVIDTLARTILPEDESSPRDMGLYVRALDRLREETGATVVVVHHTGKDETKRERGATSLRAGADTMVSVRLRERRIQLTVDKQKDAEPPPAASLDMLVVEAPGLMDEDGRPRTTCVLDGWREAGSTGKDAGPDPRTWRLARALWTWPDAPPSRNDLVAHARATEGLTGRERTVSELHAAVLHHFREALEVTEVRGGRRPRIGDRAAYRTLYRKLSGQELPPPPESCGAEDERASTSEEVTP